MLRPEDVPGADAAFMEDEGREEGRAWWRRRDVVTANDGGDERRRNGSRSTSEETEIMYEGLEEGLGEVANCIRENGPIDGVVGFSQGACAAAMVGSLLEEGRMEAFEQLEKRDGIPYPQSFAQLQQAPLKFVVSYCGFRAPGARYQAFYDPGIKTPVLHVLGQLDTVVDEGRSRALVEVCEGGSERVLMHPGGHFVPSQKVWLEGVVRFMRECVEGGEKGGEGKEEEKVEDMDVPF